MNPVHCTIGNLKEKRISDRIILFNYHLQEVSEMLECKDPKHPLTTTEKHVIDYLNDNIANIASLSITDIAEKAYVSVATVSRASGNAGSTASWPRAFTWRRSTRQPSASCR